MPRLRIAAWNVAWFARLFDRRDRLLADDEPSAVPGVSRRRQAEAIATVLERLDADIVAVIEAPNTGRTQSSVAALERFAKLRGLRQRAALVGFESPTHQEIALLFDPDRVAAAHAPVGEEASGSDARGGGSGSAAPRFDSAHIADGEACRFSKPPLEARVEDRATGLAFRLIALHLKSNAPNVAGKAGQRARRSERNRVLQRAQAAWVRARVDEHLQAGDEIVVLGDFNDGPEGQGSEPSSAGIVAGAAGSPDRRLVNPWLSGELPPVPTARFWTDFGQCREWTMVDFLLISPGLAPRCPSPDRRAGPGEAVGPDRSLWRVWHPGKDPAGRSDPALAVALDDASDHFPVSVDLAAADEA